jgi:hypothetical protein
MTAPAQRLDVAALMNRQPEPTPWRCGEIAADGFVTCLTGHGGEGKTWLAMALAVGVACGSSPAGITCRKGKVLYLDAESGERLLHPRLHAIDAPRVNLSVFVSDGLDLAKPAHVEWLANLIEAEEINLLILDSFRSLSPTMIENDGDSVAPVALAIRDVARSTGCAVILLHHRPKGGGAYRGSSALRDQVDALYVLGRADGDPLRKTRRVLSVDKMRIGGEPADRWLELNFSDGRMSLDACDPYSGNRDDAPKVREQLGEQIEQQLSENPEGLTQTEIGRRLGRPKDDRSMRAALTELQLTGTIERDRPRSPFRLSGGHTTTTTTTDPGEVVVVATPLRGGTDHHFGAEEVER